MKIMLLGDYGDSVYDEGYRNVALHFAQDLSKKHEVYRIDISRLRSILSFRNLVEIHRFRADIVHIFTSPTVRSFFFLTLIRLIASRSKGVMSALHPQGMSLLSRNLPMRMLYFIRPHLMLVQSEEIAASLKKKGFNCELFPNGVDTDTFRPVDVAVKSSLREFYHIDSNAFVILHVGHIRKNRGLQTCLTLQRTIPNAQIVLIGSTHFNTDRDLFSDLSAAGCILFTQYFTHIEELYQLADCYVFPRGTAILMPLSILEAMACNLPVVTHRFEGISTFISEGQGMVYTSEDEEVLDRIKRCMISGSPVMNRDKILTFSWIHLTESLESLYSSLIARP